MSVSPALISDTIANAIRRAGTLGLDKPHDIATCIKVDLAQAGLRIVRKPSSK